MQDIWRSRALGVAAFSAMFGCGLAAQTGDLAAIQQKLNSQFKLTTITADRSDIVTAGDVIVIHKPGLVMYSVAAPMPPSNSYKNGKIGQGWGGFGKDLMIGMAAPGGSTAADYPHRTFVPDEKCWVTGIQVQKDGIVIQLYSDPYNDTRYYANLKIPFPDKKTVPPADVALQAVSDVLTLVPQDDQGSSGQAAPQSQDASPRDDAASIEGRYFRKDNSIDFIELAPGGTFSLVQKGKPYGGTYRVEGETLFLAGPQMRGQQKAKLTGNTIVDPGGTIWIKPPAPVLAPTPNTAPAIAAAPAPMPDIAPPPPPAEAPPPTIALGQTTDQVTAGFGQPLKVVRLGAKELFFYKDMKVTFTNGKVTNVE